MLNKKVRDYQLSWANCLLCLMVCLVPTARANAILTSSTLFSFDLTTNSGGVVESNGYLFGTLVPSSTDSLFYGGAIYKVSVDGGVPKVIYRLGGEKSINGEAPTDGYFPTAGLLVTTEETGEYLYGSTELSPRGRSGGTIFSLKSDGTEFKTLYTFKADADGVYNKGKAPKYSLVEVLGSNYLYGVTSSGGASNTGVIFGICKDGLGIKCEKDEPMEILYEFKTLDDSGRNASGAYPSGPLLLVEVEGVKWLYGVALSGGSNVTIKKDLADGAVKQSSGSGVVYKIRVDKLDREENPYDFQIVHTFDELCIPFTGEGDISCSGKSLEGDVGAQPIYGLLSLSSGNIVGITTAGGANGLGAIYQFDPKLDTPIVTVLHDFDKAGYSPRGMLVEKDNKLFGIYSYATNDPSLSNVFSLNIGINSAVYQIEPLSDFSVILSPNSGLYLSKNQYYLYGTTGLSSGFCGRGNVYRLSFDSATPPISGYSNCTTSSTYSSGGGSMDKDWLCALLGLVALASLRRRVFGFS